MGAGNSPAFERNEQSLQSAAARTSPRSASFPGHSPDPPDPACLCPLSHPHTHRGIPLCYPDTRRPPRPPLPRRERHKGPHSACAMHNLGNRIRLSSFPADAASPTRSAIHAHPLETAHRRPSRPSGATRPAACGGKSCCCYAAPRIAFIREKCVNSHRACLRYV